MLINEKKKYLFVHIPRTAGKYIEDIILKNDPDAKIIPGGDMKGFGYHSGLQNMVDKSSKEIDISDYFVFTFMRDPIDKLISYYKYLHVKFTKFHKMKHKKKKTKNIFHKFPYFEDTFNKYQYNMDLFITDLLNKNKLISQEIDDEVHYKSYYYYWFSQLLISQYHRIRLNKERRANFIGRYEHLDSDLNRLLSLLKIKVKNKVDNKKHNTKKIKYTLTKKFDHPSFETVRELIAKKEPYENLTENLSLLKHI